MKFIVTCVALVLIMQISATPVVITSDVKEVLSSEIADQVPQEVANASDNVITTTEKLDTASLVEVKRAKKSHEAAEYIAAAEPQSPHFTPETDLFSSASFPAHHAVQDHHALQMAHIEAAKQASQQQFRENTGYGSHPTGNIGYHDGGYGSHQTSDYHGYQGAGHQGYGYHGGHHEAIAYQPSYQPAYQAPAFHTQAYSQTYQTPAYSQSYQAPAYQPPYQAYQPAYPAPAYPPTYEIYNGAFPAPQPQSYSYASPASQSSCGSNLMIRCSPQVQYTSCGGGGGYTAQPYSELSYGAPQQAPAYRMANADDIKKNTLGTDSDDNSKKDDEKKDSAKEETVTDKNLVTEKSTKEADASSEQRSALESAVSQQETKAQQQTQSHLDDASEKQKATMMKMAQMAQKMENNKNQPMPTQHQQQQGMISAPQMQGFMPAPGSNQQAPFFQQNLFKQ